MTRTIEDTVLDSAASELARQIDFEIISEMLCEMGWTKVVLSPMTFEMSKDIDQWLVHNCKEEHQTCGLVWIFKDPKDASWFKLRWL